MRRPTKSNEEKAKEDNILPFAPLLAKMVEDKGLNPQTKSRAIKDWWKEAQMPHKTNALVTGLEDMNSEKSTEKSTDNQTDKERSKSKNKSTSKKKDTARKSVQGDYSHYETYTSVHRKNSHFLNLEILVNKPRFRLPEAHSSLYTEMNEQIKKDHLIVFSKALRFITLRQQEDSLFVFIQASPARQQMARQIKKFAEWLERNYEQIKGAYVLYSAQDRRFNFSAPQSDLPIEYKKLFGWESLVQRIGDQKYFHHPLEFYRANTSVMEELTKQIDKQLVLKKDETLVDLYSGGGLFSQVLAKRTLKCLAFDIRKVSKASAKLNSDRNEQDNVQFIEQDIHSKNFAELLPTRIKGPVKFILNPPQGVLPAPIMTAVALQSPERIVRIYQTPEDLQKEIRKWKRMGYILQKCIPFDSQPFTSRIELLVTLSPDRQDVLKGKKTAESKASHRRNSDHTILFEEE